MNNTRILIVSNNCLSEYNSNGRTLLKLVSGIPKDNLFQIYTSGEPLDGRFCANSLRITNGDAVASYWKKSGCIEHKYENGNSTEVNSIKKVHSKNACTMLLRDLVWDHSFRLQQMIIKWAKTCRPSCVLLQVGDATLQIQIAISLVHSLKIPLITFNTEDYYFKNYDYMLRADSSGVLYGLFHRRFQSKFNAMMNLNPICIYNCEGLKKRYDDAFEENSHVIFPTSDFEPVQEVNENGLILYAGNLSVGRDKSLMEIGEILQQIDASFHIDVYGNATIDVQNELELAKGIRFHGLVTYSQVCDLIKKSRLLIHVESFDPFFCVDTKYAFSTKLPDYLMSGIPIFLYSPISGETANYLNRYSAAFAACKREELRSKLLEALYDTNQRVSIAGKAMELAHSNHNSIINQKLFGDIIPVDRGA